MKSNDQEKSLGALSLRAGIVTVLVLSALTILLKTGVIAREQDLPPAKTVEALNGIVQETVVDTNDKNKSIRNADSATFVCFVFYQEN